MDRSRDRKLRAKKKANRERRSRKQKDHQYKKDAKKDPG